MSLGWRPYGSKGHDRSHRHVVDEDSASVANVEEHSAMVDNSKIGSLMFRKISSNPKSK